jgi:hypothetical protein
MPAASVTLVTDLLTISREPLLGAPPRWQVPKISETLKTSWKTVVGNTKPAGSRCELRSGPTTLHPAVTRLCLICSWPWAEHPRRHPCFPLRGDVWVHHSSSNRCRVEHPLRLHCSLVPQIVWVRLSSNHQPPAEHPYHCPFLLLPGDVWVRLNGNRQDSNNSPRNNSLIGVGRFQMHSYLDRHPPVPCLFQWFPPNRRVQPPPRISGNKATS